MAYETRAGSANVADWLREICGEENVKTKAAAMRKYSRDQVAESRYAHMPDLVVTPTTAEQVQRIVQLAAETGTPITPRGGGSGLSGGAVPTHGGISLSVEKLNRVLEIDEENLIAVLEPGVVTNELDKQLEPLGLFFAGYPMSEEICYIGGNVAENAGGGRAIKYGVTGRYVTGLDVVLPTGELVSLGGKRLKDVTGYDLVSLIVGSEGTLGVITKIYLKLLPRPTHRRVVLALFSEAAQAVIAISAIMKSGGVVPTSAEFMDGFCLREACKVANDPLATDDVEAAVLFESDGTNGEIVRAEAETIARVCRESGARAVHPADSPEETERFWKIRKQVAWALRRHGEKQSLEDVTIPPAALAALLEEIRELANRYEIHIPVFGHAADGNIHATPLKPQQLSDAEWDRRLPELLGELYRKTHQLGGTISGEHGIGHKRSRYMSIVADEATLGLMQRVKHAFDPDGIMNPGKILPDAADAAEP